MQIIIGIFPIIIFLFYICGMDLRQLIKNYANRPLPHQVLITLLKDYKRPNDKINEWVKQGQLISLKRGLYLLSEQGKNPAESFVTANVLYGPSYISGETALAFRGLIPERVYGYLSMTTKPSKLFENAAGTFEYKHLPLPYYTFGITLQQLGVDQIAQVATAEKALFDKIVTTSGILIRSKEAARKYLLENLRMEEHQLKELNTQQMSTWLPDAPKKESLSLTIKAIESL